MTIKTHIFSDETGKAMHATMIAMTSAIELIARGTVAKYDADAGEYTGIGEWLRSMRDGKVYSIDIPTGVSTTCRKADANAGIPVPVTGTEVAAAQDQYRTLPPFFTTEGECTADADGMPHTHAMAGDGMFTRGYDDDGHVCIIAPVLYYKTESIESGAYTRLSICDTQLSGFSVQPGGMLPDGSIRPYMAYAKYPLDEQYNSSVAGQQPRTRDVSHNSLITQLNMATTGYSGRSIADDWYIKVMFLMKYATKNSQSVFAGCTSYDITKQPTDGTTSGRDVTVATGHGFVEGSAIMVGTANTDRGTAAAHDVVDYAVIESITDGDGSSTLHLDRDVTVTTAHYIKTAPWPTGACDGVQGDGSPFNALSGDEPFVLQGIELAHGMTEVMSGVALESTGSGFELKLLYDTRDEATSLTGYDSTGVMMPGGDSDGWRYPTAVTDVGGMLIGTGTGASTSTGVCDGTYTNANSMVGTREFRSLGHLTSGGSAGLWFVNGNIGLGDTWWGLGSRLSLTGRSRGEAA